MATTDAYTTWGPNQTSSATTTVKPAAEPTWGQGAGMFSTAATNSGAQLGTGLTGTNAGSTVGATPATQPPVKRSWDDFMGSLGYTGADPFSGRVDRVDVGGGQMEQNVLDPNYWFNKAAAVDQNFNNRGDKLQNMLAYFQGGGQTQEALKFQDQQAKAQGKMGQLVDRFGDRDPAKFMERGDRLAAQLGKDQSKVATVNGMIPDFNSFEQQTFDPSIEGQGLDKFKVGRGDLEKYARYTDPNYVQGRQGIMSGLGQIGDLFATQPDLMNNPALSSFLANIMGSYGR